MHRGHWAFSPDAAGVRKALCCWPGLPQLWLRASTAGLLLAVAFGALLSFALLCTLMWTELVSSTVNSACWMLLLLCWSVAALGSWWWIPTLDPQVRQAKTAGLFEEAQVQYLQGKWLEAEYQLARLLDRDPYDVEGMLLLASMLRQTHRFGEAASWLERLERLEAAEKWNAEIEHEQQLVAAAQAAIAEFEQDQTCATAGDDPADAAA